MCTVCSSIAFTYGRYIIRSIGNYELDEIKIFNVALNGQIIALNDTPVRMLC